MKRSGPIKRKTALRSGPSSLSRKPIRKKRRKSRGDADDPAYLALVRKLPCCVFRGCNGAIEAHHLTGAGMGLKARDDETMPLCQLHHLCLHQLLGPFAEWDRDYLKTWQLARVEETRRALA